MYIFCRVYIVLILCGEKKDEQLFLLGNKKESFVSNSKARGCGYGVSCMILLLPKFYYEIGSSLTLG